MFLLHVFRLVRLLHCFGMMLLLLVMMVVVTSRCTSQLGADDSRPVCL